MSESIGKYVIVRGKESGVFAGTLAAHEGAEVTLNNARRLWKWAGATETLQLAKDGVSKPNECKFTVTVDEITLLDATTIIPCTAEAKKVITEGVAVWKA